MMATWVVARIRRTFYGWWIVLTGIASTALSGGLFIQGFQFYFEPMRQQFGWSRTLLSGAYALSRVESGFLGPLGGYFVQRFGSRTVMAIGFMILALGFLLLSQTRSLGTFYIAFLVLSVGSGLASWTPVVPAITNWFHRKRARALGFMMLGMGLGGVAVAPAVAFSINAFDWQKTALGCGVLVAVVGLPLSRVMRYSPEPYGYLPDGDPPPEEKSEATSPSSPAVGRSPRASTQPEADFTVKEALKTPAFWVMSIGHSIALMVISSLGLHLVPFLETELGFSTASAAQVVIITSGATMVAQPIGGFLGDKFPKQYIAAGTMIGHATGLFLLATADNFTQVVLASALQGMAWGIRGPILTAMRGDFFGRRSFPMIQGYSHLVTMVGQIAGPLFAGYMADNYSYSAGFKVIAIVTGAGVFLFLFLRSPRPPARRVSTVGVSR